MRCGKTRARRRTVRLLPRGKATNPSSRFPQVLGEGARGSNPAIRLPWRMICLLPFIKPAHPTLRRGNCVRQKRRPCYHRSPAHDGCPFPGWNPRPAQSAYRTVVSIFCTYQNIVVLHFRGIPCAKRKRYGNAKLLSCERQNSAYPYAWAQPASQTRGQKLVAQTLCSPEYGRSAILA